MGSSLTKINNTIKSYLPEYRYGKITHISTISNSVTYLRSYTNSAIADIAVPSADVSAIEW